MPQTQMFLRTALTEDRIAKLEEAVAEIQRRLDIKEPTQTDEEWEAAEPRRQAKIVKGKARG